MYLYLGQSIHTRARCSPAWVDAHTHLGQSTAMGQKHPRLQQRSVQGLNTAVYLSPPAQQELRESRGSHLAQQLLQVPGAGGVGALVEAGAEAVEALEQGAVAARVAAAELGVAAAEGEAPRRPERRLEVQALRVRPRRPRGQRRRQQQRQGRPRAPHGSAGARPEG